MKPRKSTIALVLALCMVLGCIGTVFANATETNLVMELDKTSVDVGSTVTVTIKLKQSMSDVSWLVGGVNFDKTAFQCTSIKSVSGTESASDVKLHVVNKFDYIDDQQVKHYVDTDISPKALATTATAADTGAVGFAFEVSADTGATVSMPGDFIIKVTFKALKVPEGGTAEFSLYEQTTTVPNNGSYAFYEGEAVPGSAVNVTITQPQYKVGDVNNDGKTRQ